MAKVAPFGEGARYRVEEDEATQLTHSSILDALPRPHSLPMAHGGNATVSPIEWGLTLDQFVQFIRACQRVSSWSDLAAAQDEWNKPGHVNAYQLNNAYVVPWSAGTGSSVSLLLNESPLAATTMISHG